MAPQRVVTEVDKVIVEQKQQKTRKKEEECEDEKNRNEEIINYTEKAPKYFEDNIKTKKTSGKTSLGKAKKNKIETEKSFQIETIS